MANILVIDDDVVTSLAYLVDELLQKGHSVRSARFLKEAMAIVCSDAALDVAILDLMMPIRAQDDETYIELTGRAPQGPGDGLAAGLALVNLLHTKGIPILVLTAITRGTSLGNRLFETVDTLVGSGGIEGVWSKPPDQSFFDRLRTVGGRP